MSKPVYRYLRVLFMCVASIAISLCGCNQSGNTYVSTSRRQFVVDNSNASKSTISQDSIDDVNNANIPQSEIDKQGQQRIISGHLLWPPIIEEDFEDNYTVTFENRRLFYDVELTDDTVNAIEASYSYYCNTNKINTSDVEIISVEIDKDVGLCHTVINTAGTSLECILEVSSNFQRVDYIEGNEVMDTFGVFYVNMDGAMKERITNLFNRYIDGEGCELYSLKEYNCCYYYFYRDKDGDNRYIRVSKENNEVVDDGMWDENGIIKHNEEEEITSDE